MFGKRLCCSAARLALRFCEARHVVCQQIRPPTHYLAEPNTAAGKAPHRVPRYGSGRQEVWGARESLWLLGTGHGIDRRRRPAGRRRIARAARREHGLEMPRCNLRLSRSGCRKLGLGHLHVIHLQLGGQVGAVGSSSLAACLRLDDQEHGIPKALVAGGFLRAVQRLGDAR